VGHTYNPSYLEGWHWEDRGLRPAQANSLRPHLQNNQSKMDWRCGSSSRVPALQVRSPEFKFQSYKKERVGESLPVSTNLWKYEGTHIREKTLNKAGQLSLSHENAERRVALEMENLWESCLLSWFNSVLREGTVERNLLKCEGL
jgi:hypothetical protein